MQRTTLLAATDAGRWAYSVRGLLAAQPACWGPVAFVVHTVFIAVVRAADVLHWTPVLPRLHENFVDRHAYELWWRWVNTDHSPVAAVAELLAKTVGTPASLELLLVAWYVIVGGLLYFVLGAITGKTTRVLAEWHRNRFRRT